MRRKIASYIVLALVVAQVALILVSWLVTAAWPETSMHSLLSSGGIRWLFGSLSQNLLTPLLVWLLLGCMAYGTLRESGLLSVRRPFSFRQKSALRFVFIEALLLLLILFVLTSIPHAALLSVTGELFPSSFSDGLIPFACLGFVVMGITFGLSTGRFNSLTDVVAAIVKGFGQCGYLWLIYMLGAELYASIRYFWGM